MNCKVLIICPEWEVLHDKCIAIANSLREKVDTDLITEITLNILKYIKVDDGLVILPQICVLKDNASILILTREEIDRLDISDIINEILKYCR